MTVKEKKYQEIKKLPSERGGIIEVKTVRRKVFRSRVSVAVFIMLLLTVCPIVVIDRVIIRSNNMMDLIPPAIPLIIAISILFSIHYVIDDENLCIKLYGFRVMKIPVVEIHSVKRSYDPLSSTAASLKRLAVYKKENGRSYRIN
jgi:hypothetical protein